MAHSRGRFPRNQSPRKTVWNEGPGTLTNNGVYAASTTAIIGLGQTSLAGITLARIRGYVELGLQSSSAAGDGYVGAIGLGIVNQPAFVAGVASMPAPVDEVAWGGWMWHQYFSLLAPTAAQTSENRIAFELDTKAMRKMGPDETVFLSIQITERGTATLEAVAGTRMLVMLP